ncbi:MAG: DEAD/DEAH box helicase [Saprospiraceae bacterium]|nr:DEAD/DEAH box helicase [Saprospiraceae bacterium]
MLRDYQQAAHDAAISWIKKNTAPAVIESATGSGKSHIIAALADSFYNMSGKHVLCTAPSAELVQQNYEKFLATGNKASIFSASLGKKSLRHPVVFGTPGTIKNSIAKFGDKFGLIVIDECHGITPTIQFIIDEIRMQNDKLRICGLTATPMRLGTGLIYAMDENGKPTPSDQCRDPYFTKKIYSVKARELIDRGYLTNPVIGAIHGEHYDTINMKLNSMGKFVQSDIDRAFTGQGRKTSMIISDIVNQARHRQGVMIFAATIKHALECVESLPPRLTALVTGETPKPERAAILKKFKARELKYLVNVSVLTTGFDAPHVDLIAILRATESVGLLQQIIGRGLRIDSDKKDCLILDYAENLERHCPDHDIFNPKISIYKAKSSDTTITAKCELCETENEFSARPNEDGFDIDAYGYYVDLNGIRIMTEYGPMSAHYGRRCMALHRKSDGKFEQCRYYWTSKECPECGVKADIAARYCSNKHELIDPNERLIIEYRKMRKDPHIKQTEHVLSWSQKKTLSSKGNECLQVNYVTEHRNIMIWYQPKGDSQYLLNEYNRFISNTKGGDEMPISLTYQKQPNGFYRIFNYNETVPEAPVI